MHGRSGLPLRGRPLRDLQNKLSNTSISVCRPLWRVWAWPSSYGTSYVMISRAACWLRRSALLRTVRNTACSSRSRYRLMVRSQNYWHVKRNSFMKRELRLGVPGLHTSCILYGSSLAKTRKISNSFGNSVFTSAVKS